MSAMKKVKTSCVMKRIVHYLFLAVFLFGVPWFCAAVSGREAVLAGVKAFPPRTEDWGAIPERLWNMRCPFSWPVFLVMLGFILLVVFPFIKRAFFPPVGSTDPAPEKQRPHPFPLFGWIGLILCLGGWILAWNRFPWFAKGQRHTYLILWAGFILLMNGLCVRRSGSSPLTRHTLPYLLTFPVSSVFWWFFEYLNRFVWNWYYQGVQEMSAGEYTLFATCSFSSVLPAVCAVAAWLHTFPAFSDRRQCGMARIDIRRSWIAAAIFLLAMVGLTGIVFFPQFTYPLLWISPLCLFLVVQIVLKEKSVADTVALGDWRIFVRFAFAALICGLAWETWNWHSLAKWIYAVPYVHAFQIWEMPILGFAGYLPFGIECAAVTAWIYPALIED